MSLYGYICFIFLAELTLLIAAAMPTIYSRDQLLPLRTSATPLSHDQCLRITQLGLRRRGCRAGNHRAVAGPSVWKALPDNLRDPAVGSDSFRRSLKTFLFATY